MSRLAIAMAASDALSGRAFPSAASAAVSVDYYGLAAAGRPTAGGAQPTAGAPSPPMRPHRPTAQQAWGAGTPPRRCGRGGRRPPVRPAHCRPARAEQDAVCFF